MALSNEKVSKCITDDLALSIMSKLPLKALNRFKCVRKSWVPLFENPYFMNMYRKSLISNNSYDNDTRLLLKQTLLNSEKHSSLYLFSSENFDNKVKLDWPPPIEEDDRGINILGSGINGVLCLYVNGINSKLVVWNPAIQEFKVISPNPAVFVPPYVRVASQHHGFGYDCVRNDYKVVRYVEFFTSLCYFLDARINMSASKVLLDPIWEIYSLKSNSWKKLDLDRKKIYQSPVGVVEQVYLNGVCHWLGKSETDIDNLYLVSFDLGNEVFLLTSIPSIMDNIIDFGLVNTHLLLLNESIALIYKDAETTTFHISILGEIGVKESWAKLFIVGPFPCLGDPIGVGKNGDIFFAKEDEELARCDLTTNTVQELGIKSMFFCSQIVIYKKNLLSIEE
ncbi:unnamed protein product [Trifolium pratense]|uniref:Uncharacterized protein n=1 Tax=Trifolium pratense TaxID=57577 RepID=A0ACB0M288_TRIPR|nr:unnamed protein product [Trifolium pratense]